MAALLPEPEVWVMRPNLKASGDRPFIWFLAKPLACAFFARLFEGAGTISKVQIIGDEYVFL